MTRTIFALLLLCLSIAACDPVATETNTNGPANTNASSQASPAPAASPATESSPVAQPALKAGDKVKFTNNGAPTVATVVSVDEKLGQVTVKLPGETKDKTVAIAEVVKQQ